MCRDWANEDGVLMASCEVCYRHDECPRCGGRGEYELECDCGQPATARNGSGLPSCAPCLFDAPVERAVWACNWKVAAALLVEGTSVAEYVLNESEAACVRREMAGRRLVREGDRWVVRPRWSDAVKVLAGEHAAFAGVRR